MAIYSRTVTARFSMAVNDGIDANSTFDNILISDVTVQFIPTREYVIDGTTTTFFTTIEAKTNGSGRIVNPNDDTIGVKVPVWDPAEGVTTYRVRVIPPDGSRIRPYEFMLALSPGDTPVDITTTADLIPSNSEITVFWVGATPPTSAANGVYWLDISQPYRYQLKKWTP